MGLTGTEVKICSIAIIRDLSYQLHMKSIRVWKVAQTTDSARSLAGPGQGANRLAGS